MTAQFWKWSLARSCPHLHQSKRQTPSHHFPHIPPPFKLAAPWTGGLNLIATISFLVSLKRNDTHLKNRVFIPFTRAKRRNKQKRREKFKKNSLHQFLKEGGNRLFAFQSFTIKLITFCFLFSSQNFHMTFWPF